MQEPRLRRGEFLSCRKEREAQLKVFEDAFSEYEGLQYIPFSSLNGEGVDVLREILSEVTEE